MAEEAVRWNATGKHPQQHRNSEAKTLKQTIVDFHQTYNDITIMNISGGVIGFTVMINNASGEVWVSDLQNGHPDFSITAATKNIKSILKNPPISQSKYKSGAASRSYTMGFSINFGSILGGKNSASEINNIIAKSSVGYQACHIACAGLIRTQGKDGDVILTYGVGSSQLSVSAGNMVKIENFRLTKKEIEKWIK